MLILELSFWRSDLDPSQVVIFQPIENFNSRRGTKQSSAVLKPDFKQSFNFYLQGEVMCTVTATFGSRAWVLPKSQVVHPKGIDKFKHFARFLLEGKVITSLAR